MSISQTWIGVLRICAANRAMTVEFSSAVDALRCASEFQTQMAERNETAPMDKRVEFRMGINVGDIVVEDGDIFGDGVNVAVRLEGLAEPGGICISARVQEDAAGKLDLVFEDMGEQALKNIARPVRTYRVRGTETSSPRCRAIPRCSSSRATRLSLTKGARSM
jgi:class 3 adenylate cyclase